MSIPLTPPPLSPPVSIPSHKLNVLLDTHGLDPLLGIALSQDASDEEAKGSMERLIKALSKNSPSAEGEVLWLSMMQLEFFLRLIKIGDM